MNDFSFDSADTATGNWWDQLTIDTLHVAEYARNELYLEALSDVTIAAILCAADDAGIDARALHPEHPVARVAEQRAVRDAAMTTVADKFAEKMANDAAHEARNSPEAVAARRAAAHEDGVQQQLARLRQADEAKRRYAQEKATASGKRTFADGWFDVDGFEDMDEAEPLIDGVLDAGAMALLVGQPGTGKTFIALDMALSVATGRPWCGHSTTQGRVMYLVGEGGGKAFGIRMEAWRRQHGVTKGSVTREWFYAHDGAVPFMSDEWHALVDLAVEYQPSLIVVDTLSRHAAGMDENSNTDAAAAIAMVAALQERTDTAVMVLHHPNKMTVSATRGNAGRGAGAWEGAADAIFGLSRDGDGPMTTAVVTMTCTKQKHRPDGQQWHLGFAEHATTSSKTWKSSLAPVLTDPAAAPSAQLARSADDIKATAHREWTLTQVTEHPGKAQKYYAEERPRGRVRINDAAGHEHIVDITVSGIKAAIVYLEDTGAIRNASTRKGWTAYEAVPEDQRPAPPTVDRLQNPYTTAASDYHGPPINGDLFAQPGAA